MTPTRHWRATRPPGRRRIGRAADGQAGTATAETAVAVLSLLLVLSAALWAVSAASLRLACGDAARAAARVLARGESSQAARAAAAAVAPRGATVTLRRDGPLVIAQVRTGLTGPGPFGRFSLDLRAEAVADVEASS